MRRDEMRTQDHSPPAGMVLFHIGWSMSTIIIITICVLLLPCVPCQRGAGKDKDETARTTRDVCTLNGERAKGWANNGFVPSSSSSAE